MSSSSYSPSCSIGWKNHRRLNKCGRRHTEGIHLRGLQYEYTFKGQGIRQGLVVWVINNDIGYQFNYISDQGHEFSENLPVRKVLDSVEFIPIEVQKPKQPSFMQ
jgi:hypothetical protein